MIWLRRIPQAISLLSAGVLLAGCGTEESAGVERVVLITCDTLRADRLGMYGFEGESSPRLDAFAEECVVFDRAYASAPLTLPALSSVMTGMYPDDMGTGSNLVLMPAVATTMAEVVRAAGIPTAAVVSNWVLRSRGAQETGGLEQGFVHYDALMEDVEANRSSVRERIAANTTDAALTWLEQRGADRFFLWVHYQDPHGPYTPPEEFIDRDAGTSEQRLTLGRNNKGEGEIPAYQVLGGVRDPAFYDARYVGEIRYFDREVGRFLDGLRADGLMEDALIIFTADHGESLGEHDWWFSHGQTLHDELVHVPLLIRYPEGVPALGVPATGGQLRHTGLVGHVDLFATVVSAFGLVPSPSRGVSLLAESLEPVRFLVQSVRKSTQAKRWESVTDGRWRLIKNPAGEFLFDLDGDPGELRNLAREEEARVTHMRREWANLLDQLGPLSEEAAEEGLDAESRDQMEALGYSGTDED